jgi:hypothetical protein
VQIAVVTAIEASDLSRTMNRIDVTLVACLVGATQV